MFELERPDLDGQRIGIVPERAPINDLLRITFGTQLSHVVAIGGEQMTYTAVLVDGERIVYSGAGDPLSGRDRKIAAQRSG